MKELQPVSSRLVVIQVGLFFPAIYTIDLVDAVYGSICRQPSPNQPGDCVP